MAAEERVTHGGTCCVPNAPPKFRANSANRCNPDFASGNAPYSSLPLRVSDLSLIFHPSSIPRRGRITRACPHNLFAGLKKSIGGFMKNAKNIVATAIVAVTLSILFLNTTFSAAQDQKLLTKNELATLLKTAKEPPDHLRIAAYYTQEATSLRQSAKEHSALAAIYEQTHPFAAMEVKHGDAFGQGASHCKKFSQLALEESKEADALATLHKEMANTAGTKGQ
jgi:hypothetical protein